jgi:hypothetical protein
MSPKRVQAEMLSGSPNYMFMKVQIKTTITITRKEELLASGIIQLDNNTVSITIWINLHL